METSTTTNETMSSAQLTILILLLIERIAKFFVNSKCYKHLELNLFGMKVIDLNSEESEKNPNDKKVEE